MAEEKTKKFFVRAVKGFPAGVTHRRAGFSFEAGPTPQEVELTSEQVDAIEADPSLEFVSSKDAQRLTAAHDDLNSIEGNPDSGKKSGRKYDSSTDDDDDPSDPPTADQLAADNKRDALIAMANDASVEGLDYDDKAVTKQVIAEAIVAKRDEGQE